MSAPNALITAGLTRLRRTAAKRGTNDRVALDEIIVDHENSTRFATQEELSAKGLYRCQSEDREEEKEQLGVLVAPQSAMSGNAIVEAAPTSEPAQSLDWNTPSRSHKTGSDSMAKSTAQLLAPVVDDHMGGYSEEAPQTWICTPQTHLTLLLEDRMRLNAMVRQCYTCCRYSHYVHRCKS